VNNKLHLEVIDIKEIHPVLIECNDNELPKVYAEASVYIPDTPEENKEEYITSVATENRCCFASILDFHDLHIFGKYAKEHTNAVVSFSSKSKYN
jgi:hypothetical protein